MQFSTVISALFLPLAWASQQFHGKQVNFTVGQIVETSSGAVAGHAATKYSEVSEYLGIPYALPPVCDLRFAAPVKYARSSMLNASTFGSSCAQLLSQQIAPTPDVLEASNVTDVGLELFNLISNPPGVAYSEDCLYLNVWSKPQSGERQKAVMVYIHGGGFTGGSSSLPMFNGAALASREDIIIVTLNYRLSILGFPGNPEAQNNVAFLDQRLAIEWVRDNIANFGGDPARITLFGQSAGGASADYYSYAYATSPIITGVIAQSGTSLSSGLPYSKSASAAAWYTVTRAVGCGDASTNYTTLLACMRDLEVESILNAVPTTGLSALLSAFGPTIDNITVFSNYSQRTPASIPILIGSNDYEAGTFRTQLALAGTTFADSDWEEMNLASWTCPAGLRSNASIAANNPTWRYRYHAVFPNTNISSEGGAYHGAELTLLFGTTSQLQNSTAEEINLETYIQGAWAAFAKDPVNGLATYEGGWPPYDPAGESLVRLGYDNLVGTNLAFPELYDAGCVHASLASLVCRVLGQC
ncbi:Alpha/Beta hydrolase protein [Amylocarpus encephaloides]|uniref:Carboxylic ester hydrolase n=1 Tax=Amylocarpus encephaloides TaxID=45428 RepID=A0A9P7YBS8_9HELO|nr:Alpha/Beta hydrolase protein [Amylocarpus encephaloides]